MTIKLETDVGGHPKTQFLQVSVFCFAWRSEQRQADDESAVVLLSMLLRNLLSLLSMLLRNTRQTGGQCERAAETTVRRGSERSL